jgi:hypothetical protein
MAKEKSIEFTQALITSEVEIKDNYIYQIFRYDKKLTKYLTDSSYILYNKLERKLRDLSIFIDGINFIERINDRGEVILVYEILLEEAVKQVDKTRKSFKLVDFTPPNPGCAFCVYKKNINEDFFHCEYKEKTMSKEIKTCRYFKQKRLYKT